MKTLRLALILGLAVVATASAFAADLNVTGNITATGTLDTDGNTTSFGAKSTGSPTLPGVVFTYTDNSVPAGAVDSFQFLINRNPASWLWLHNTATTGTYNAMRLDEAHQLILYRSDGTTAGLTFTPQTSVIKLGTNASATLTGDTSTGLITAGGGLTVSGSLTASSGIANTTGAFTSPTALSLIAGGTNQNVTLTPSGTGNTVLNGNVGIGTTSPLAKLDVKLATNLHVGIYNNGGTSTLAGLNDAGNLAILKLEGSPLAFGGAGGVEHMRIDSAGNVGVGNNNPGAYGKLVIGNPTSANSALQFITTGSTFSITPNAASGANGVDLATSFVAGGSGPIKLSPGGATVMSVLPTGNVGIGTTTPVAKLDVNGNLSLGTAGQSIQWNQYSYGSYLDVNNSQNALRIRRVSDNGIMAQISDAGTYFQYGNVGIGTTNPSNKLEVAGNIYANGAALISNLPSAEGGNLQLYNTSKTGATANNWVLFNMTGVYGNGLAFWRYYADGTNAGPSVWFGDNGNVGIGTRTPGGKLEVRGDIRSYLDGADSINGQLYFANSANSRAWNWQLTANGSSALWGYDGTAWGEKMRVASTGNVGIGTTNPTQKLSVAGTIRAYEVIVDTGWADYVFDSNYRLAPLSEVEQHIKTEKHLPGIPSAAEIAEHGVSMGDMQSRLLSKIEELTLHMIEQEKQQVEQQKQMIAQQVAHDREIADLHKQLEELRTSSASKL